MADDALLRWEGLEVKSDHFHLKGIGMDVGALPVWEEIRRCPLTLLHSSRLVFNEATGLRSVVHLCPWRWPLLYPGRASRSVFYPEW
jgi:hypothetical protein